MRCACTRSSGGEGPPPLLVHGWPENWYAWRRVMPALAGDFEVIAVDQRGIGRSEKPARRYDTGTLADDLVALMDALGHERYAVVGHDTGHFISYALAADHPDRVVCVALLQVPGPPEAPSSLRGSLAFYRAWDKTVAQNAQRKNRPLTMPVLAVGGAASWGELVPNAMKELANDVQGAVIPGTGHRVAEESPQRLLAALTPFLAPYRDASAAAHAPRSHVAARPGRSAR